MKALTVGLIVDTTSGATQDQIDNAIAWHRNLYREENPEIIYFNGEDFSCQSIAANIWSNASGCSSKVVEAMRNKGQEIRISIREDEFHAGEGFIAQIYIDSNDQ